MRILYELSWLWETLVIVLAAAAVCVVCAMLICKAVKKNFSKKTAAVIGAAAFACAVLAVSVIARTPMPLWLNGMLDCLCISTTSSLWNYRVYGFQIPYALFLYLISEKMQKSNVTSFLRVALKKTRNKSIVLMLFTTWWAAWSYLGLCRYLSWGNWRKSFICLHQ